MPPSVNIRYLETTLMTHGFALFFYDDTLGIPRPPGAAAGELNVYGEPSRIQHCISCLQ